MLSPKFYSGVFLLAFLFSPLSGAIIVDYNATENDRFTSGYPGTPIVNGNLLSSAYPSNSFDFSGVGWSASSISNSVALISNQHFVTAKHNRPSGSLNFLNQDGSLVTFTIDTNGWHDLYHSNPMNPINSTIADLHVGTLTVSVQPADKLNIYSIATGSENDFLGKTAIMYGRSDPSGGSPVVGTNEIVQITTLTGVGGINYNDETRTYVTQSNSSISGDFQGQTGDSGSPSFLNLNGTLVLTGTHFAVGKSNSELTSNDLTYDSFANYYTDQIADILTADGETLATTAIPEPGTTLFVMSLLSLGLVFCKNYSKRSRRFLDTQVS